MVFSLGLHPYCVSEIKSEALGDLLSKLQFQLSSVLPAAHAVGECGLDFRQAPGAPARAHQVACFRGQLEIARTLGLPLTLHCVGAHGAMLELLRERPTPPSVLHAFSGSAEVGRQLVAMGHYLSFAGNLCIPGARKVVEAARSVPAERMLIETDAPDQTPPGRRPAPNEPAFVVDVAARLAEVRGESLESVAAQTWTNACRVFGLADDDLAARNE